MGSISKAGKNRRKAKKKEDQAAAAEPLCCLICNASSKSKSAKCQTSRRKRPTGAATAAPQSVVSFPAIITRLIQHSHLYSLVKVEEGQEDPIHPDATFCGNCGQLLLELEVVLNDLEVLQRRVREYKELVTGAISSSLGAADDGQLKLGWVKSCRERLLNELQPFNWSLTDRNTQQMQLTPLDLVETSHELPKLPEPEAEPEDDRSAGASIVKWYKNEQEPDPVYRDRNDERDQDFVPPEPKTYPTSSGKHKAKWMALVAAQGAAGGGGKKKPFACKHCPDSFYRILKLKSHVRRQHPTEREPKMADFPGLERPRSKKKKGDRIYRRLPDVCPFPDCSTALRTLTRPQFRKHMATHTKPYECPIAGCGERFRVEKSVRSHCGKAHLEVPESELASTLSLLSCTHAPSCKFTTPWSHLLAAHTRLKHDQDHDGICKVDSCSFRAFNASKLKQHTEKVHEGKTNFLCIECGKGYYYQAEFTLHVQGHRGEKPWQCDLCGKGFLTKYKMQRHRENTHKNHHSAPTPALLPTDVHVAQPLFAPSAPDTVQIYDIQL